MLIFTNLEHEYSSFHSTKTYIIFKLIVRHYFGICKDEMHKENY